MLITLGVWAVVVLIAVFVLISVKKQKNNDQKKTNYKAFFLMGPYFFSVGSIFTILSVTAGFPYGLGVPFFAMGTIYIIIGLSNHNKGKKLS